MINTSALTTSTLLKLIDAHIKPVATYGCPIWLPSTNVIKALLSPEQPLTLPKAAGKDTLETTHLKMLKWILGIHCKSNNNFCYGDTGRTPWAISAIPQCISYYLRASQATSGSVNTLLHHTFKEQQQLNLSWYNTWSNIVQISCTSKPHLHPTLAARLYATETFVSHWEEELLHQTKMSFYVAVKDEFKEENYLQLPNRQHRQSLAKLRSSSHDLRVETGRYKPATDININQRALKACRFCHSLDNLRWLAELPFLEEPVIESEEHVVTECPGYHNLRSQLTDNVKSLIMLKAYNAIMSTHHVAEFGKYLTECYHVRNPQKNAC